MKKRFRIAALALASIMALSMTACGGGTKAPDAKPADAAKPAAEAEKPAGEARELIFTSWANTGEIPVLSKAVDAYNKIQEENKTGLKVTFRNAPGEGYEQNLITQLAAGTGADCFYAGEGTISKLIQNGTAAELSEYMGTDKSYCKVEDFADGLWGAARSADKKIYGITVDCNPVLMYYSPKKFQELGIEDPHVAYDAGKWTFDAFDKTLGQLNDKGLKGFILGADAIWVYNFMINNGGTIWSGDKFAPDAKAVDGLKWLAERMQGGNKIVCASTLPKGQGADASFISGQVGFVTAGRWYTPTFHEAKVDFDYVPFPSNTATPSGNTWIATAYMAVNGKSKMIDDAKNFATYYCSKDGQSVRLGGVGNAVPSINGIDNIVTDSKVPAHVADIFAVRETGWANGGTLVPDGRFAGLNTETTAIFEDIFVNGKSVDEMLPKLTEVANKFASEGAAK